MTFFATQVSVLNRGRPPAAFLREMVEWGRSAPDGIFAPRPNPNPAKPDPDIYAHVKTELGPWKDLWHRRAVMLEVMRVLAGFESSWDHTEGVDTSRLGEDTPENSEAGAWQVSYDARRISDELWSLLTANNISNGVDFQRAMKFNHELSMEFTARLLRHTTKHHGPLYKGAERAMIRKSLRGAEQSVYPWLSRASVAEFQRLLQ